MDEAPRLLVWNFSQEEKQRLDDLLQEIQAPPAFAIAKKQGFLPLKTIIHTNKYSDREFSCDEKIILFYNIPQKGVYFLIQTFKANQLPQSIYAVVTEHSINWPFSELVEHLVEERNAVLEKQRDK